MLKTVAGDLVLEARRRARLSQAELARRARVPHSVISAIEHGRRDPGAATLDRLLRATGHRLALAGGGPDPLRAGKRLAQVLDLASRLPRRRRGRLAFPPLSATSTR